MEELSHCLEYYIPLLFSKVWAASVTALLGNTRPMPVLRGPYWRGHVAFLQAEIHPNIHTAFQLLMDIQKIICTHHFRKANESDAEASAS